MHLRLSGRVPCDCVDPARPFVERNRMVRPSQTGIVWRVVVQGDAPARKRYICLIALEVSTAIFLSKIQSLNYNPFAAGGINNHWC